MLARTVSATVLGIEALMIQIEVDITKGLPAFNIVGLPDKAVRESRERVRSAIKNSDKDFPVKKITINMAPADVKKIGPHFDLAIATGILAASGMVEDSMLTDYLLVGELSLSGEVRRVKGILPMALRAVQIKKKGIIVPAENYREARLVEGLEVIPVKNLEGVVSFFNLQQVKSISVYKNEKIHRENQQKENEDKAYAIDFSEIKGQQEARRALEVAAAGVHNLIMVGPPGSGKTMMAKRVRTILPPLNKDEALELTRIYSIMGLIEIDTGLMKERPFRAPHHNTSRAGLIGGGRIPEPGEVSLAHRGTLFLDEMPEFNRDVLEMLRQPLEEGRVTIIRSEMKVSFPADFMMIAAMNPCPCGYYGDNRQECQCSVPAINRYRSKISGPLLDRIDIHIQVPALKTGQITDYSAGEDSASIRKRVMTAHKIQLERYQEEPFNYNSQLQGKNIPRYCAVNRSGKILLESAIDELGLSARAYDRILRLARTIADLQGDSAPLIQSDYLAEAIQYRNLDRRIQI